MIEADIATNNDKRTNNTIVSVHKIIEETEFTDRIQTLLEYGNRCKLKSFKLRLVMESPEERYVILKNRNSIPRTKYVEGRIVNDNKRS